LDGTDSLRGLVKDVLDEQPGTDRLLLVVDQWEELYTASDEAVARRFIDELLDATQAVPLSVVLTLAFAVLGYRLWLETQGLDFHYRYVQVVDALGGATAPRTRVPIYRCEQD
jgi:hypothetical protein